MVLKSGNKENLVERLRAWDAGSGPQGQEEEEQEEGQGVAGINLLCTSILMGG